ncbi:hypothetical protein AB0K48_51615 [Nonomuraea sp. NPDC055795]
MAADVDEAVYQGDHSGFGGIDLAVPTFATAVARGLPVDDAVPGQYQRW